LAHLLHPLNLRHINDINNNNNLAVEHNTRTKWGFALCMGPRLENGFEKT